MNPHTPHDDASANVPGRDAPERPSKSQIKRDMHALLDLGKELVDLPPSRLKQLPLADKLHEAIREAQRITSREGRRRQIHYVGKLMRDAPAEAIRATLAEWRDGSRAQTAAMHRLETLRDQLIADDGALTRLLAAHPHTDVQALRTQIRAARKEATANATLAPGREPQRKHYRALFQTIKSLHDDPAELQAQDDDSHDPD